MMSPVGRSLLGNVVVLGGWQCGWSGDAGVQWNGEYVAVREECLVGAIRLVQSRKRLVNDDDRNEYD